MNKFYSSLPCFLLGVAIIHPVLARAAGTNAMASGSAAFGTCYVRWNDHELVIGNEHFERVWRVADGLLTATSFRDFDARCEWLAAPADRPAPYPAGDVPTGAHIVTGLASSGRLNPVEEESLVLNLTAAGSPNYTYRFQVFPAAHGVTMQFKTDAVAAPADSVTKTGQMAVATGAETEPTVVNAVKIGDSLEDLMLAPEHLRLTQVKLLDQTDDHNELVFENEWLLAPNERLPQLSGNLFNVENTLTGAGLIFLKLGPLPHARPVKSPWDLQFYSGDTSADARRLRFAGPGYPFVLLSYSGGRAGRIEVLQTYQRQLRCYDPQRDGMFTSNTWGDRARDAHISEGFMLKEIAAAARLGVDVVQIDDGWEQGSSANSASGKGVWRNYWESDPNFWQINQARFPSGLAPVVKAAHANGMKFGLWFGPDSNHDAANWQRDANRLLELNRLEGIEYLKLDSMNLETTAAENNFQRMWNDVLIRSEGRVTFDLDVTAGIRPGYFGAIGAGPLWIENRYTDWHRYWPHQTLRNLWKLSQYVDPLRLQMEFLNNARKQDRYPGDPLAPAQYSPDALFATVMFCNPLGFFEVSNLDDDYIATVSKLVAAWKRERSKLFSGHMIPIGAEPDGTAWTGFASVGDDWRSGYLLLFRELNSRSEWTTDLPLFGNRKHQLTVLAGCGSADLSGETLTVKVPKPLEYLWVKIDPGD